MPISPRLCILGDTTEVPDLSKHKYRVVRTGLITCVRLILRCWRDPQTPTLNRWKELMIEMVACEMLERLNPHNDASKKQWGSFSRYVTGKNIYNVL